jgi:hypothetical protein
MFLSRSLFLRPSGTGSEVAQTRGGRAQSLADFCLRELEGRPEVSTPVDILYVVLPSGGWTIGYR